MATTLVCLFFSPVFPGISGPIRPWSGGLGLDSGMTLSSVPSGAAGFAFGTAENKITYTHTHTVSLGEPHALNYNDLVRIIFYYLLICLLYSGKVIFARVESVSEVQMKAQKEEGQVRERLQNTLVSLSCRKK